MVEGIIIGILALVSVQFFWGYYKGDCVAPKIDSVGHKFKSRYKELGATKRCIGKLVPELRVRPDFNLFKNIKKV